ncbi:MAG: FeoB-associated Cys-rich membrane protein [Oscillospiraceae bacterium]|nr:FeoB-associated Cys-rich membrane protein [Oscillospiraceae bacterium]
MNMVEIAIIAGLAVAVFFALRHMIKMRKSGCSCGCSGCNGACEKARKK